MSGVLENLGKKISNTIETAQKELRHSVANSLNPPTTTLQPNGRIPSAGSKTKLFSTIFERSQRIRDTIIDRRDPVRASNAKAPHTSPDSPVQRDEVQDKLAIFARLEKEFCDLIEAYEIMLAERRHLEEILVREGELESLDDLELVGQYYKALQDNSQISKSEIARLTQELHTTAATVATNPPASSSNTVEPDIGESEKSRNGSSLSLINEKAVLASLVQEHSNTISSLESQKMALETKVSYLQKQLCDHEGLKTRLQDLRRTSQEEIVEARALVQDRQMKLDLAEHELAQTRKTLQVCQAELHMLKDTNYNAQRVAVGETYRLEEALKLTESLLREDQNRCHELQIQLSQAQIQVETLQQELAARELDIMRTQRANSIDSFKTSSMRSPPLGPSSTQITPESNQSLTVISSRRSSADAGRDQSLVALKNECERLAIENSRLRTTSQTEYLRNVILRYFQLPERRRTLLPVIANVLRFSDEEIKSIKK